MKKLIISTICLLAFAAGVSSYAYYHSHQIVAKNSLAKANVVALTDNENQGLWERIDEDCTYTFYGKAGSTVSFTIGGKTIFLTVGANGYVSYVYGGGKTRCVSGGNEQCTARYCPEL